MYNSKHLKVDSPSKKNLKNPSPQVSVPFESQEGFMNGLPPEGHHYRILGDTLFNPTPFPITAVANTGQVKKLLPFDTTNVNFDGADYVDEYLDDDQIAELKKGGYIIEEYDTEGDLPKAQWGTAGMNSGAAFLGTADRKAEQDLGPTVDKAEALERKKESEKRIEKEKEKKSKYTYDKQGTRSGIKTDLSFEATNKTIAEQEKEKEEALRQASLQAESRYRMAPDAAEAAGITEDVLYDDEGNYDWNAVAKNMATDEYQQKLKENFLQKQQAGYDAAPWYQRAAHNVSAFLSDPILVGSQLMEGKGPLTGQMDWLDDPAKAQKLASRFGLTAEDLYDMSGENDSYVNDLFKFVNPGHWGTQAGVGIQDASTALDEGRYLDAAGNIGYAGLNLFDAGALAKAAPTIGKGSANMLNNASDFALKTLAPVRYVDDVIGTTKMKGKFSLPKYQNTYRIEHPDVNMTSTRDDVAGRWFLKTPNTDETGFYLRNLKDPTGKVIKNPSSAVHGFSSLEHPSKVRIMTQRLPEYKINQQFGVGMPEEARMMSMGRGDMTNTQLDEIVGAGAGDRFTTGKFLDTDYNAMETAPFLYNPSEGILNADQVNKLRTGNTGILSGGKSQVFDDQAEAFKYFVNESEAAKNISKFRQRLPFEEGGYVDMDLEEDDINFLNFIGVRTEDI